jgi:hypothetical protein
VADKVRDSQCLFQFCQKGHDPPVHVHGLTRLIVDDTPIAFPECLFKSGLKPKNISDNVLCAEQPETMATSADVTGKDVIGCASRTCMMPAATGKPDQVNPLSDSCS